MGTTGSAGEGLFRPHLEVLHSAGVAVGVTESQLVCKSTLVPLSSRTTVTAGAVPCKYFWEQKFTIPSCTGTSTVFVVEPSSKVLERHRSLLWLSPSTNSQAYLFAFDLVLSARCCIFCTGTVGGVSCRSVLIFNNR